MTDVIAVDTSVAIPLLLRGHEAHDRVVDWWGGRRAALSGHALAETYSVLTRLPVGARLRAADAARLLDERFEAPFVLSERDARHLPSTLAALDITGGAVYDAMVALAARTNDAFIATRDARATATYEAVGVRIEIVG